MNYGYPIETRIGMDFYTNDSEAFEVIRKVVKCHSRSNLTKMLCNVLPNVSKQELKVLVISEFLIYLADLTLQETVRFKDSSNLKLHDDGKPAVENDAFDYREGIVESFVSSK